MGWLSTALTAIAAFLGWRRSVSEEAHNVAEREAGQAQQKAATDEASLNAAKGARDVANDSNSLSDADTRRVSGEWTRPADGGKP